MRVVIHEFPGLGSPPCECVRENDGFTARPDAVTCPACLERLQQASSSCPACMQGYRCSEPRGHQGLHRAKVDGAVRCWSDGTTGALPVTPRR